jgi:hypothetical protein
MKPLPPLKPPEKLPITYHLTVVRDPEKGSLMRSVVVMKMRGDEVLARKVLTTTEKIDEAMDDLNRAATRMFYFDDLESVGI